MKTSVVLIEDYGPIRQSYEQMINTSSDFEVVGSYESAEEALKQIEYEAPAIILIDIKLPGLNGIEAISYIKQKLPKVIIIMMTIYENSEYVFKALKAGAVGYLTKNADSNQLLSCLKQAIAGGAPMSVKIARMVVESFQEKRFSQLTKKEHVVLSHLAEGKSYASISDELNLSLNTIKYHVRNIYIKLHVSKKDELIDLFKNR